MRKYHSDTLSNDAFQITGDDLTECSIWDASCQKERTDVTCKRERKVFKEKTIMVRLIMRNPLMVEIPISKVRLQCHNADAEEEKNQEFDATYANISTEQSQEKQRDYKV